MTLAEKMFDRSLAGCRGPGSSGPSNASKPDLFSYDWEVFVIRHDPERGKFSWHTLCCEPRTLSDSICRSGLQQGG
jgi:hypothetical protein